MKIGIASLGSPDYLIDIVTDGLIRTLGRSSLSLEYNVRGQCGGAYSHLLQGFEGPEPFGIYDADALIASSRSGTFAAKWMKKTGKRKVAFLDGEDGPGIQKTWVKKASVYFKREYLVGKTYEGNVKPLQFAAIPEERFVGTMPKSGVMFRGHPTHETRKEISKVLSGFGIDSHPHNVEKKAYNLELSSALIGVSVRGQGWDTYRYWETPYFGAAMIAQRHGIVIPGDFEDGKEAVFFDGSGDLKVKLKMMLEDEAWTKKIASQGLEACVSRHLSIHRAKVVLEAVA